MGYQKKKQKKDGNNINLYLLAKLKHIEDSHLEFYLLKLNVLLLRVFGEYISKLTLLNNMSKFL